MRESRMVDYRCLESGPRHARLLGGGKSFKGWTQP